jgi:hypothetical protein
MITSLRLANFKGFEEFTVRFRGQAFLAGPNNAGKSTVLSALRVAARLERIARRRTVDREVKERGSVIPAYSFSSEEVGLVDENLRHEFRQEEVRLELIFKGNARLTAVWPAPTAQRDPYFYLVTADRAFVRRPRELDSSIGTFGAVPVLTPVDQEEEIRSDKYLRAAVDSRLASRHFRNQLRLLKQDWHTADASANRLDEFFAFARPWLPSLRLRELHDRSSEGSPYLDLYYEEGPRRTLKEVFWAGDGMQIWVQLLFHVYRLQHVDSLLLDEPEVFLHPDLQRRLVRLLETTGQQAIVATHAPDMLAEASQDSVVWIERSRRAAVRAPNPAVLLELSRALGTNFSLPLGRALRARVVLFVEGLDMKMIRNLAATLGFEHVAHEEAVVVQRLIGFSNWEHVEPFAWLTETLLQGSVALVVFLDRGYQTNTAADAIIERLGRVSVAAHVWTRKELESYLLVPDAIARLSGADASWILDQLVETTETMKHALAARRLQERLKEDVDADHHQVTVTEAFWNEFDTEWRDVQWRLGVCDPKKLMSELNRALASAGHETISAQRLSAELEEDEIADELRGALASVEEKARG